MRVLDLRAEVGGSIRLAELTAEYEPTGSGPSSRRYGYVVRA